MSMIFDTEAEEFVPVIAECLALAAAHCHAPNGHILIHSITKHNQFRIARMMLKELSKRHLHLAIKSRGPNEKHRTLLEDRRAKARASLAALDAARSAQTPTTQE